MGGITPTEDPTDAGNVDSQPMAINPNQRTFQSFNNNLPANMYGPVTTGKTYENSPYFIQPYVDPVATTNTNTSTNTSYTPVATDAAGNTATYLGVDPYDSEGDDNFLTQEEVDSKVKIIQDVIGNTNYNPNTDVLTKEQQDLVMNQTTTLDGDPNTDDTANRADIAMDDIYNNNQQIYGTETGNNITSLVTGQSTGTPAPWTPPGMDFGYGVGVTNPSTFVGPIATGTTLPTGSKVVNDYSDPATLAKYKADRAPGGIHYESSGSQRREAEQRKLIQSKDDQLAQSVDTSELAKLANRKDTAKQWLKDNGYGNYDKDDASDVLRSKIADINKSQLQQGLKDGIIYKDDRREVYVDGVMVGNPKGAEDAREMLAKAKAAKAETAGYNNGTPMVTQNYNYGTNMVTPGGK